MDKKLQIVVIVITLIGVVFAAGVVAHWILSSLFEARVTEVDIGGVRYELPTDEPSLTSVPSYADTTSYLFVRKETVRSGPSETFTIALSDGEVIAGQSWEMVAHRSSGQQLYVGCVAFLIVGPGEFTFSISDGWWAQYEHATSDDAEALLQEQVNLLIGSGCTVAPKVVRIP